MWSGTESPTACTSSTALAQLLLLAAPLGHVAHQGQHGGAAAELRAAGAQLHPHWVRRRRRYWSRSACPRVGPVADALLVALHHQRQELGRDEVRDGQLDAVLRRTPEQRRQRRIAEHDAAVPARRTCRRPWRPAACASPPRSPGADSATLAPADARDDAEMPDHAPVRPSSGPFLARKGCAGLGRQQLLLVAAEWRFRPSPARRCASPRPGGTCSGGTRPGRRGPAPRARPGR